MFQENLSIKFLFLFTLYITVLFQIMELWKSSYQIPITFFIFSTIHPWNPVRTEIISNTLIFNYVMHRNIYNLSLLLEGDRELPMALSTLTTHNFQTIVFFYALFVLFFFFFIMIRRPTCSSTYESLGLEYVICRHC